MIRFCTLLTVGATLAALAPGTAAAQDVDVVRRDLAVANVRTTTVRTAPTSFTMVGIHWQGSGKVWFRTAAKPGAFGSWRPAQPEGEDRPDPGSEELAASSGWRVGNPWWTGPASLIQYRLSGKVTRLRTYFVNSRVTAADRAMAASARSAAFLEALAAPVAQPAIIRRSAWGADESIVRGSASIAARLRFAVIHHTAGSNSYSAAQSAAIVRGIQQYHVLGNGWDDIGYNFLVDKYGQVFEGRRGGIAQNVIGAHAGGFNTGSVGVSVLGNYDSVGFPSKAKTAVQRLLAWRLDVGHVYPRTRVDRVSGGSSRWPAGTVVRLRGISGHRDTSYTSCPGNNIYGQLDAMARTVTQIGLPKLWDPEAEGSVGEPVRFTGRLSASRPWLVQVKDSEGAVVAQGSGTGTAVDWTWDATAVPIEQYTYTMSAGAEVRPATYPVPGPPPLAITGLKAAPLVLTPNDDWAGESTSIRFGLTRRAVLGVRVLSVSTGNVVRTLMATNERAAGKRTTKWNGRNANGVPVADGQYRIEVSAADGGEAASASMNVVVDATLGGVSAAPSLIGKKDSLEIGYALTRQAAVSVEIRHKGKVLHTVSSGNRPAGSYVVSWDGLGPGGKRVADGDLTAAVSATTSLGTRKLTRPFTLDTTAPVVTVLSFRRSKGVIRLRFRLSEAAQLRIWFGRNRWNEGVYVDRAGRAGVQTFTRRTTARVFRIVATDAAQNRGWRIFRARR
jgi:flagellar hook assembly protein FlgD